MKKFIQKNYRYFIFCFIAIILVYVFGFYNYEGDSYANFSFCSALVRGNILYTDINTITTPLYTVIMSLLLYISDSYFVFLLEHVILFLILQVILYKMMGDKSYLIIALFVFSRYVLLRTTYNFLLLILLVLLTYLEENYKDKDYLIGFIIGLSILTKHVVGVFFIIPSLIFYFRDKDKLFKRFVGLVIPCIIFLMYLLFTGSLYSFLDLCLFGLFDFANKNSGGMQFDKIMTTIITIIMFIISLMIIIRHKKDIRNYYLILGVLFVVPLFDFYHFYFFFLCFCIMIAFYLNLGIYKKFVYGLIITITIIISIVLFVTEILNREIMIADVNKLDNTIVYKDTYKNMIDFNDYLDQFDDVIVLSYYSKFYTNYKNRDFTYYDIPMYGNFGYDGINKMIKKIENTHDQYFAIGMGDYTNPNDYSQFYKEVCKYVIDNYEFVDGKGIMFIYYKE